MGPRREFVRRHAKASSAGSSHGTGRARKGLFGIACLCLLGLVAFAGSGASVAAAAETECANEALRAESNVNPITGRPYSKELPDCRAFEMVSPVQKQSTDAELAAVADGSMRVELRSGGAWAGGNAQNLITTYLAQRGPDGWTTAGLMPPPELSFVSPSARQLPGAPDLSYATAYAASLTQASEKIAAFYFVGADGVTHSASPFVPYEPGATEYVTSDDSHTIVFENDGRIGSDEPATGPVRQGHLVHEVVDAGGPSPEIRLVQRRQDGTIIGGVCGAGLGGKYFSGNRFGTVRHAVSRDGSRIFFSSRPGGPPVSGSCGEFPIRTFARVDHSEVIEISHSQCTRVADPLAIPPVTACDTTPGDDEFVGASADGSRVFIISPRQLTNSDTDVGGADLYEYDFSRPAGEELAQISRGDGGAGTTNGAGAGVKGFVNFSEDGSHAYFVASGVLTSAANPGGAHAVSGANNLYVYERDAAHPNGRIAFVAGLAEADEQLWTRTTIPSRQAQSFPAYAGDGGVGDLGGDGHILVVASKAKLTSDDTDTAADVYRYVDRDAGATLDRISIGGAGTGTGNNSAFDSSISSSESLGTGRAATEDGSTIVFITAEPLVEGDLNVANDAFRWKAGSVASVSLGTAPGAPSGARSAQISASGRDIYFDAGARLVGQDGDTAGDIYDARIEGGFAAPPKPAPCDVFVGACQPESAPPPLTFRDATSSFSGRGNVVDRASCAAAVRQVRHLKQRAAQLRRRANQAGDQGQAGRLRSKGKRISAQAKRAAANAKRCQANRGGTR